MLRNLFLNALILTAVTGGAQGAAFQILEPAADAWHYTHSNDPGGNGSASTWSGGPGDTSFDNRASQMFLRFNTSSIVAPGQGAGNYALTSLTLSLTVKGNSFLYDPTYDSYRSRLASGNPNYLADSDPGTPVELFGVGYRNGYSSSTFAENSPVGATAPGQRNAYAAGYVDGSFADVSNNVTQGREINPFAVGQIDGVTPGAEVILDSVMTFTLNLSDPLILGYLQESLNAGYLEFMVTSLYKTEFMAPGEFPVFYTKENALHDPAFDDYFAGQLAGDVTVVPEPSAFALIALGLFPLAWCFRKRIGRA